MTPSEAIYSLLSGNGAVTAICSTRIYPLYRDQEAVAPCVTYQQITNQPSNTKSGVSTTDAVYFQINCIGLTYAQAHSLKEAVRTALDYQTAAGIQTIVFEGERALWDDNAGIQGEAAFSQDYLIRHNR